MITFKTIRIENFKSIDKVDYEYTAGVWEIVGQNNDSSFNSNASGKSTLLEALQQCLYNRTYRDVKLDETINRVTGKPYTISLNMNVDGDSVTVINCRQTMKITVYINGTDLGIKSIPLALKKIQEMIGMDFSTFTALTYVSHQTVIGMLDNFTDSNLSKVLLDFHKLAAIDKAAKARRLKLNATIQTLTAQIHTQKHSLENLRTSLNMKQEHDVEVLQQDLIQLQQDKQAHLEALKHCTFTKNPVIDEVSDELDDCSAKLQPLQHISHTQRCPTCNSELKLSDDDIITMNKLNDTKDGLIDKLQRLMHADAMVESTVNTNKFVISEMLHETEELIKNTQKQLDIHDWVSKKNKAMQPEYEELVSSLAKHEADLKAAKVELLIDNAVIQVIKSGSIQQNNLNQLVGTYNMFIQQLLPYVSLNYINLEAKAAAGRLEFVITTANGKVSVGSLSGGEATRIKVVALLALLKTVQTLTKNTLNILVFDEALDGLDSSASEDLARLFHHLATTDSKCIALVSHGEQLKDITFTGRHLMTKTNGISTLSTTLIY